MKGGQLFIISAPSGSGKTSVVKGVMATLPGLAFSVSHTTRQPRALEENGVDYFFTDRAGFLAMRDSHAFLEWAEVHGNLYGTSQAAVRNQLARGIDIILDIDIQGARQLRENLELHPVFIFIAPPSRQELERRLIGRGTESSESIELRCRNALAEMADLDLYDYLIVNDKLDEAITMLRSIIIAERSRSRRLLSGAPANLPWMADQDWR